MMHAVHKCLLVYLLTCLEHHAVEVQIISGWPVPYNLMPYMASVQNRAGKHVCGGFLISEDFVLTAAHCNKELPTSVVLGTHNLRKVHETMRFKVNIVKTCPHPSYKEARTGNDIMLLKLLKKAPLKMLPLPEYGYKIEDYSMCHVAGWGATKSGGAAVDELQAVEVFTLNLKTCHQEWSENYVNLPANIICAGGYDTDRGFCRGDSGGPLVCGGMAVGVVSFNYRGNCVYPNAPNVYTEVSKYLPWINTAIRNKNC